MTHAPDPAPPTPPAPAAPVADELPSPSLAHKLAWAVLALGIAGLIGAAFYKKMHPPEPKLGVLLNADVLPGSDAPKPQDLAVWGQVKDFSLTDQNGHALTAQDLRGEVWVANFVFTRCSGTCPQMTRAMADLNRELADQPAVKLISFSMDPDFDTPEVLSKYVQTHDAASPRWKFLTGDKAQLYRLTREDFQLVVKPNDPKVSEEPIIHSSKFVLVDAAGKIRGRFDGLSQDGPNLESMKLLADSVRKLKQQ